MKTIINGISISYDDRGNGPAVILIHGFPLSRRIWAPQVEALGKAFRVIAPDLRGFGGSDAPDGPYTMELFADDLVALMDHLGLDTAAVCGMSMGGYVLLNMLDRYPERIRGACLMVTRSGADDEAGKARRLALAQEVLKSGPQVVADVFSRILFAPGAEDEKPDLVSEVSGIMMGTSSRGLAGGLLAMRERADYSGRLGGFNLPALVVGAEQDKAIPPEESRLLAEALPDARLVMIPSAGHMAGMENPGAVNEALSRFLLSL
jgi:3-oxoadipate enol-lactonase